MTKAELITHVARESNITKKAAGSVVDSFVEAIHDSLMKKNGSIHVASLGTFKIVQRRARTGVNPRTQEKMNIPAKKAPSFSPSKSLRESVMGGGKTAGSSGPRKSSVMDELKCKICGLPVIGELPFCKDHKHDAC
jgi:DNA-binding protein HU-beta